METIEDASAPPVHGEVADSEHCISLSARRLREGHGVIGEAVPDAAGSNWRSRRLQPTGIKEADLLAGPSEFVGLVTGDEHCPSPVAEFLQHCCQTFSHLRVEGLCGLVEDDQVGPWSEDPRQSDQLPLPAGERSQPMAPQFADSELSEQTPGSVRCIDRVESMESTGQLRLVSDVAGHSAQLRFGIVAEQGDRAAQVDGAGDGAA